jgi:hypothetical protein
LEKYVCVALLVGFGVKWKIAKDESTTEEK